MASVGSDHQVVSVKIRLSLRAKKKSVARVRYIWRVLENGVELQDKYEVAMRNRLHLLSDNVNKTGSSRYASLMEANNEAAKETLTPISKWRKDCLFSADPRVIDARQAVEEATRHLGDNNCAYIQAKESLSRDYDEVLAEDLARKVEQAEACCNNNQHSAGWMLVWEIAGDHSSSPREIDGETEEDRVNSWYCHLKNLLGNPLMVRDEDEEIEPVFHDLPINEYHEAKQSLRAGKSCGENGVYSEVLRRTWQQL